MGQRSYRLTDAGREAWEGQDAAVPADYRRILWMMDFQDHASLADGLLSLYPKEMLDEWLAEMEEIGLIETVPEGQQVESDFAPGLGDRTVALDKAGLQQAVQAAGTALTRTGAFIATDRLKARPAPGKAAGDSVILIVEDDPDQLALADLRLHMAGYRVRVANSVNAFLQAMLDEGAPDLLLLDVMLPDGDGFDVLSKMRRHQALGSLPIVMLTAKNEPGDIGRGLLLGADGYITKPYTKNILADVIRRVLKHSE